MTDTVNHPPHYTAHALVECIDAVGYMPFPLGNAVKYLVRAGRKDSDMMDRDIQKAVWYLRWWFRHGDPVHRAERSVQHIGHRLAQSCLDETAGLVVRELTSDTVTAEDVERCIGLLGH